MASTLERVRRRRARLKNEGVLVLQCELPKAVGEQVRRVAEMANLRPSHVVEMIVAKHFARALPGKRSAAMQAQPDSGNAASSAFPVTCGPAR
jgi:hypothetical protein